MTYIVKFPHGTTTAHNTKLQAMKDAAGNAKATKGAEVYGPDGQQIASWREDGKRAY